MMTGSIYSDCEIRFPRREITSLAWSRRLGFGLVVLVSPLVAACSFAPSVSFFAGVAVVCFGLLGQSSADWLDWTKNQCVQPRTFFFPLAPLPPVVLISPFRLGRVTTRPTQLKKGPPPNLPSFRAPLVLFFFITELSFLHSPFYPLSFPQTKKRVG